MSDGDTPVAPPDAAEVARRVNDDPDGLVAWTNSIERMLYDWKDLVHEMDVSDTALARRTSSASRPVSAAGASKPCTIESGRPAFLPGV